VETKKEKEVTGIVITIYDPIPPMIGTDSAMELGLEEIDYSYLYYPKIELGKIKFVSKPIEKNKGLGLWLC
jgi:hypothetical protein